jgi:hypothetical protein
VKGDIMQKEKSKQKKKRDPLPESFDSLAEAAEFWDTHDSADYEDIMKDVDFEVDINRHIYFVPVAESVFEIVREKARSQGVSTETMVNLLLQKQSQ